MEDSLNISGFLHLEVINIEGRIIDTFESSNLVVNGGKDLVAGLLVGADYINKIITQVGIGNCITSTTSGSTDNMTTLIAQTSGSNNIANQFYKKDINSYSFPSSGKVQINFLFYTTEGNGINIKEFGLYAANGTLFNRISYTGNAILKSTAFSLNGYITITIN